MAFARTAWALAVWAVFVALPLGYLVECTYKPQLLLNETTRYLYQYRDVTTRQNGPSLVPGLFYEGEAKTEVETQLLEAGLDALGTRYATLPPGSTSLQRFRLRAGARNIACGSELFVTVGYDAEDRLISATVEQGGACL